MLIRIKFEGKSRKLTTQVKTIQGLREEIAKLFGPEAQKLNIVYKDCDDELVNVFDDDDILNCFSEAEDLKLSSVTFILKAKKVAGRSISSKSVSKSPLSKTGSSDSDMEQAPPLPLVAQSSVNTATTGASKQRPIDMTPEEFKSKVEIEATEMKKRVEEEYKRKMELADVKAQEKIKMMEKKREMKEFKEKCAPIKTAIQSSMKAVMSRLRFLNKTSLEKATPSPSILTAEIIKEAFDSCAGLATSPELANLVLAQVKSVIVNSIKSAYTSVASSNPHLVKEGIERIPQWEQFAAEVAQEVPAGPKICRRRRSASHDSQEGSPSSSVEKKRCRRDLKHAEKHGHHGFGHHGHHGHGHHAHGHEEFSHKHGHGHGPKHSEERHERARLREERRAAKDAERAHKDEAKAGMSELKDKVRALKDQFPRMDKQELKQIVLQNATVAVSQLVDLVKAYKRNKSSAAK